MENVKLALKNYQLAMRKKEFYKFMAYLVNSIAININRWSLILSGTSFAFFTDTFLILNCWLLNVYFALIHIHEIISFINSLRFITNTLLSQIRPLVSCLVCGSSFADRHKGQRPEVCLCPQLACRHDFLFLYKSLV